MSEWLVARDNGGLGYKTETREWEQENPAPRLQDKMIFNKRPDDWNAMQDNPIGGNVMAEESLLAIAMYDPAAIPVLAQLSPKEFTDPLHQKIGQVLVDHWQLNEPTDAVAVEQVLRADPGVPQEARWDSSMPIGDVDRTDYGLQGWEKNAGVIENAVHYAGEIREQYRAAETMGVTTWAHQQSQALVDIGPSPSETDQLHRTTRAKLALVPESLSSHTLSPPSPDWRSPLLGKGPELRPFKRSLTPALSSRPSHRISRART